jgi:hypothetical protein
MPEAVVPCPQCGAPQPAGRTCRDDFDQMLFWENENPANGAVHHLMVLCFHIQHPDLYSPEGLAESKRLLMDFLEGGLTPDQVRRRNRGRLDSGSRSWKIKGKPGSQGAHANPVTWPVKAADVVARGEKEYVRSVEEWAGSVLEALRATGNVQL